MNSYGFAVDLGTTTIDCCLVRMEDKSVVCEKSGANPQSLYGSDVINRIMTVTRDKKYLDKLKQSVCDFLLTCFSAMLSETGQDAAAVHEICICGNTTMVSILLGLDITSLGVYPFEPQLKEGVVRDAHSLFDDCPYHCPVYLSGCAKAFIGGDILAGLLYVKTKYGAMTDNSKNELFLDLGTNGEMVLFSGGNYIGASTACGPAFESCTRRQNIYGASIIEAIALAVSAKKLDVSGAVLSGQNELYINNIRLTPDIIQAVLLAKAAVCAGIQCLCSEAGIEPFEIDTVYLAGGFGFYLPIDSAVFIGLLPKCFQDHIHIVGNTSLAGAIQLLATDDKNKYMHKPSVHILNFAELLAYQDIFISNMFFRSV